MPTIDKQTTQNIIFILNRIIAALNMQSSTEKL